MEPTDRDGGRLITLEGLDGAGKSMQADRLARSLRSLGHVVCLTREPGGTRLGERVRELLLSSDELDHRPASDALLFNAARAQLVAEVIRPALDAGTVVICDRYADSTLAYQGYGEGLDLDGLRSLALWATGGLVPDLTLLLDVPEDVGIARRVERRDGEAHRFEGSRDHDAAFQRRVREGFLALAAGDRQRWRVIDASQPPDAVAAQVLEIALRRIGTSKPSATSVRMDR